MRPLLFALCASIFLGGSRGSAADNREDRTWEFYATTQDAKGQAISVRMVTGPWEPSEHKIEEKAGKSWRQISYSPLLQDEQQRYRIDGRETIWGADGFGWPDREVKLFVVKWGEKVINVPRKHWRDYYWLLLCTVEETRKNPDIVGCWTKMEFDRVANELVVTANGGGGAGWYQAKWQIKEDGSVQDSAERVGE